MTGQLHYPASYNPIHAQLEFTRMTDVDPGRMLGSWSKKGEEMEKRKHTPKEIINKHLDTLAPPFAVEGDLHAAEVVTW